MRICTFDTAVAADCDVKTTIDTGALQGGGKVREDRKDWRIVHYDAGSFAWTEVARDYLSQTETWFKIREAINANSSNGTYYVYYGCPDESTAPHVYTHSAPATCIVLDSSQAEAVRGYYNGNYGFEYRIGTATTADAGLSFAKDSSNPIIAHGLPWEGIHVHGPFVVYNNGLYMMYYNGDWGGTPEIGLAVSTDGISFTKYGNGPVVPLGPDWDSANVSFPFVFVDNEETDPARRFKMLYAGSVNGSGWPGSMIGCAYSADGFTWSKYPGNPILQGASGQWDTLGVIPGAVVAFEGTYRMYFIGYDGSFIQTGLATAASFEGPYEKSISNPIIPRKSSGVQNLTSDLNAGSRTVIVSDTNVFSVDEPVWLFSSAGTTQLTRVQSKDSPTQLTIADDAGSSFTVAQGAYVRSWLYGSNFLTTVEYDGTGWKGWLTAFMVIPGLLRETTAYATSTDGISWTPDYSNSPPLALGGAGQWDAVSAENLRIVNTPPHTPANFSATSPSSTAIDWSWTVTSSFATGITLEDENQAGKKTLPEGAATWHETGLAPDTPYIRHARSFVSTSYNSVSSQPRTSHPSEEYRCFTMANAPGSPGIGQITRTSLEVSIDPNSNPAWTEYAMLESGTGKYVQLDGTLGNVPAWSVLTNWGGASGQTVRGLTPGQTYTFLVKARNGDGLETPFSGCASARTDATEFYFAEGYTGPDFAEYLCLGNPNAAATIANVTYFFSDGTTKDASYCVPATGRTTVNVNSEVGSDKEVSIKVQSDTDNLVAERPMYFNYKGVWTGGSDSVGATAPTTRWYFAEGTTLPDFDEYVTVLNPTGSPANLTFHYMVEGSGERDVPGSVEPHSRATFNTRSQIGDGVNAGLLLSSDRAVVAERPMYFDYHGVWTGGHDVVGANSPSESWYFAEGTTRAGFDEWLCLQNPGDSPVTIDARYLPGPGQGDPVAKTYAVPARRRLTVSVNSEVGAGKDVSIQLTSTGGFIAERPMYFNYDGKWTGGHDALGANNAATTWLLAEGTTRGGFNEWLCLLNPGAAEAHATITYYAASGKTIEKHWTVNANSRLTINVNDDAGPGQDISSRVSSDNPIIIERPMYFNYDGKWTGGHDVVGFYRRVSGSSPSTLACPEALVASGSGQRRY